MKKTRRYNASKVGDRAWALARQVALLVKPEEQILVQQMHEIVGDYSAVLVNAEQRQLLAACGAMAFGSVLNLLFLDEKQAEEEMVSSQYVAHLIRSIYTLGVIRGRAEAKEAAQDEPLEVTLRQLKNIYPVYIPPGPDGVVE